ncbi:MAG: hypothetical protein ACRC4U_00965 [Shewanella sp.]
MMTKTLAESIEFDVDGNKVWAVVRHNGTVLARERIPRQYLNPNIDVELQAWYFKGIAKRLKAKMRNIPLTGANGRILD